MKLLYIANVRFPTEKAYGIQIAEMCSSFAKASEDKSAFGEHTEVELVVPTRKNSDFQGINPFEYYGVRKNFSIQYLNTHDPTWLMKLRGGVYIKVQSLLFMRSLRKFFSRYHTLTPTLSSSGMIRGSRKKQENTHPSIPSREGNKRGVFLDSEVSSLGMTEEEETIIYSRDEYLLPFLLRYSENVVWEGHTLPQKRSWYVKYWNQCRAIVTISRGLKEELVRLGVSEQKILVAPDGVDLEKFKVQSSKFKVREELQLPTDKKIILYTGHLYEWKGADVLLGTARKFHSSFRPERSGAEESHHMRGKVNNEIPRQSLGMTKEEWLGRDYNDVLFLFVGGTKDEVERFRAKPHGIENVLILGHKPYRQIPLYQMAADVLVLPNTGGSEISEKYTSPLKLFEYMAAGVPIVASDLPSMREILNGSNSVLVKPDDAEALGEGIRQVLQNPEFAVRIAEKARQDVHQYSWEKRAEKILHSVNEKAENSYV